ncbi:MAG: SpoIIE family protein phosphatase [Bacteroidaceae bacterium]|nr:SpoIIE family protein phosphatase [Bacteroidaceae bacterium]
MNFLKKLLPEALRSKSGVTIIVTVAVLLEIIFIVEYLFARKGIREDVEHRAETELRIKNLEIQKVMVAVETAIGNTLWAAERNLEQPDSLYSVLRRMVEQNPTIVGAGLMFRAGYYPQKGHWFEPYVAQRSDGTIEAEQIGSASHNYLEADFYKEGIAAGKGRWSEPYFDEAGAKMMLCTYTIPVHDSNGEMVALLGADVSLEWLSHVINATHIYPSSYNVVISRTGMVMAGPDESLIMRRTIQEVTASSSDTTTRYINQQQMSGKSGHQDITDNNGDRISVFYAPVDGETGWSMSVVCSKREVYADLWQVSLYLSLLMLAGLLLLGYIIYRAARSASTLRKATAEKERIGSELRIARNIQESMLPKTFPPYPERKDVDIFASLVPAKEVGGDLYDFHIRDEKLFFCIGDVSGKGVPASLVMAVTRSLFRTVSAREDMPQDIVTAMNEAMADMNDSDMFVTLFVGVLDLKTGLLHYCNAGHEDPLLIGKGVGLLPTTDNIPVGLMPGWNYEGQEALIYPQTTIFLYTDGLTEAENSVRAQFGKLRMIRTARQLLTTNVSSHRSTDGCTYTPQAIINAQTEALHRFVGNAEQSDDLTMLAIQYLAEPGTETDTLDSQD